MALIHEFTKLFHSFIVRTFLANSFKLMYSLSFTEYVFCSLIQLESGNWKKIMIIKSTQPIIKLEMLLARKGTLSKFKYHVWCFCLTEFLSTFHQLFREVCRFPLCDMAAHAGLCQLDLTFPQSSLPWRFVDPQTFWVQVKLILHVLLRSSNIKAYSFDYMVNTTI